MSDLLPLILKKRDGQKLSHDEISGFVKSLLSKNPPPDYQIASFLAFIVAKGMDAEETFSLTDEMRKSGKVFKYSGFSKDSFFVDKHSTGGVGDKITLPLAPIVAAASERIYFPTIAGRALGHTGGTVDKLESIPGFKCGLEMNRFYKNLKKNRLCFLSQTPQIAPADRILYALRDVTGTVASVPLITASILSKKLSESLNFLLIDLKMGSGAFLTDPEMSEALAQRMLKVLSRSGVGAQICLTNMDTPLGHYSGNLWEVKESIDILMGRGPEASARLTREFARRLLCASGMSTDEAQVAIQKAIESGAAFQKWNVAIASQGGSVSKLETALKSLTKMKSVGFEADREGYLRFDVTELGLALVDLGGGRKTKKDKVDVMVGFQHLVEAGSHVRPGHEVLRIYYRDRRKLEACLKRLQSAVFIEEKVVQKMPLILKEMTL